MDVLNIVFGVFGGLALFLFGLHTLTEGLNKIAGEKLKDMIEKLTDKPYKGALVGAFTVAAIHSSGIMMVTMMGLINAGLLTLSQAIGVMLGGEIGTTFTAQMISFKIGIYALPIIAIGFLLYFVSKNKQRQYIGQAVLGVGILFLGMNIMADNLKPLQNESYFAETLKNFGQTPLLGILIGAIFTGIIQSSTAFTGLVIAMGMENVITLPAAIALTLGANVGSCITGMLASMGSSISSKRLSLAQLIINVSGVMLFLPFLGQFAELVTWIDPTNLARQIANTHTIFNITVTLVMLPLVGVLVKIVTRIIPGEDVKVEFGTKYIDKRILNNPTLAISQASKEVQRMAEISIKMLESSFDALLNENKKAVELVQKNEKIADKLYYDIDQYLESLYPKELTETDALQLRRLMHAITDLERIADHAVNIAEYAEYKTSKKIKFSKFADKELTQMYEKTKEIVGKATLSLNNGDEKLAEEVLVLEDEIDDMERKFKEEHMERHEQGICTPAAGVVFVEILRNLERIGDHSTNIANTIKFGF